MKRIFYRMISVGVLLSSMLVLADFQLVRDGKPEAVIVLHQPATRSAQLGAFELQYHIRKMTGAELPIVKENQTGQKNVIWIGGENSELNGDASKILFRGKKLLLTGNDTLNYGKVNYKNHYTFPRVEYECKGTLFAVYDFLEYYCGIRFFGIDDKTIYYPESRNLAVREKDRHFDPPLDGFRYVYNDGARHGKVKYSPREELLWRLRWRMNTLFGMTNHNQYSIFFAHWGKAKNPHLAKAFKGKRKELFAHGFDGRNYGADPILRNNYPDDSDLPPQLCYSCRETVKYYADEVLTYYNGGNVPGGWYNFSGRIPKDRTLIPRFRGKPFFYPIQGGDTGGHCLCENCKKRFPDDNKDNVSNNKFAFMADVAREAAKTNPAAGVSTLAYIQTLAYPRKVQLPENLSVQLCLTIYSWWHPVSEKLQMAAYREWIQKEAKKRPLTLWTYIFSTYWDARLHFGKYKPFPGLYPWKTGELFKMFTRDGVRGWFTEVEMQYNHLEAYVAARICYDPSLDPEKLLDEFFAGYYGAAGPVMKEFYREIEKAYWNPANCPAKWLKNPNVVVGPNGPKHPYWGTGLHSIDVNWSMGTPERMKKLKKLMANARKMVRTPEEKIRLKRFVDEVWTGTLEGEREYQVLKHRRNAPPKQLIMIRSENKAGNPEKVDWNKVKKSSAWTNTFGREVESACSVQAAADQDFLYLRLHDGRAPLLKNDVWKENFELFFHEGKGYPVYHLAVTPGGTVIQYKHEQINDAYKNGPYDFKAVVKNITDEKSWTLLLAIPWNRLPLKKDMMSLNFMRSNPAGNTVWNPIYTISYLAGMDSFGALVFYPKKIQETEFSYHGGNGPKWQVTDSAASDGKAAAMPVNRGWTVQFRVPRNFVAGRYKLWAAVRTDVPVQEGLRHTIGFYNTKLLKITDSKVIPVKESSGKEYKLIPLGTWNIHQDGYLYIGGVNGKFPKCHIYVDYIQIQPEK